MAPPIAKPRRAAIVSWVWSRVVMDSQWSDAEAAARRIERIGSGRLTGDRVVEVRQCMGLETSPPPTSAKALGLSCGALLSRGRMAKVRVEAVGRSGALSSGVCSCHSVSQS
jgi:hypothetical protein